MKFILGFRFEAYILQYFTLADFEWSLEKYSLNERHAFFLVTLPNLPSGHEIKLNTKILMCANIYHTTIILQK